MNLKNFIKNLTPNSIKSWLKHTAGVPNQVSCFKNLKQLGFRPKVVLDIGAYEGLWAKEFKSIYPLAKILMFEAQPSKEELLKGLSKTIFGSDYKIALLGAKNRQVDFHIYDTASSVLTEHYDTNAVGETRNLLCLDDLLTDSQFSKPDFIKVDTQGYELEILMGGEKTLSCAGAVLLEVSLIDIYKEVPLVYDVLYFMKERGFVLFDICSLIYRPLDKSLYQSDFLFVKEDSFLRANKKWS